jgi:hypothetical protein
MKKMILSVLATIAAITVSAQGVQRLQLNEKTNKVTFSKVVENPDKDKVTLFSNVQAWIALSFKSGEAVTDLADQNAGKFILKPIAILPMNSTVSLECKYLLTITVKDGKARIIIDNIHCDYSLVNGVPNAAAGWGTPEEWLEGKANGYKQKPAKLDNVANLVADNMETLLLSFESAIKQKFDDEDW